MVREVYPLEVWDAAIARAHQDCGGCCVKECAEAVVETLKEKGGKAQYDQLLTVEKDFVKAATALAQVYNMSEMKPTPIYVMAAALAVMNAQNAEPDPADYEAVGITNLYANVFPQMLTAGHMSPGFNREALAMFKQTFNAAKETK